MIMGSGPLGRGLDIIFLFFNDSAGIFSAACSVYVQKLPYPTIRRGSVAARPESGSPDLQLKALFIDLNYLWRHAINRIVLITHLF